MTSDMRSVVIHGHFYQPPREDPWTGSIRRQPSAAPYHDWNERVAAECYGPVVASRVIREGEPDRIINSLEWMSFNFGPTLMVWLESHEPGTYAAILEADRRSAQRLNGHGNAIAMPYHHPILPLSTERDRRTEIRWGIADFRRRFGRDPEGLWLPETAVDGATLDALAGEGILFVVLAPHQVDPVPDDGRPGRYVTSSGKEIALFAYDGRLSHGVAFGDLLEDGVAWAALMAGDGVDDGADAGLPDERAVALRSIATDGETFGHHHTFGEMGLAKAIVELQNRGHVRIENYASFLAREGMGERVNIVEPSAWSCAHGVDRWRADCGCRIDPGADTQQAWRRPLREALAWLADGLHSVFEEEGRQHFADPWAERDAYGKVVARMGEMAPNKADPTGTPSDRARELLEMERDALRLFTSCAWFFDDVGGIEPRQVLAYAAHGLELAGAAGDPLRAGLVERLRAAVSNDREVGTAADVFEKIAESRSLAVPDAGAEDAEALSEGSASR
ncbi:MAG: DUF3536 domain-containing protein [Gemmatimonadetes bacterium]|nr:DUF3536 domain-containing protein [Gemmatimonadota bacterium]